MSYAAHGQDLSNRAIASGCVSRLSSDFCSPFRLIKTNAPGDAFVFLPDSNTTSGSKHVLEGPLSCSLSAKNVRKPRASISPLTKLNSNSSSERYGQPAIAKRSASVDFPLPDGPMMSRPLPLSG